MDEMVVMMVSEDENGNLIVLVAELTSQMGREALAPKPNKDAWMEVEQ
jgi:hypothetical protein